MRMHTCKRMHAYTYTHTYARTHTHTHTHKHKYTHTHTHTNRLQMLFKTRPRHDSNKYLYQDSIRMLISRLQIPA